MGRFKLRAVGDKFAGRRAFLILRSNYAEGRLNYVSGYALCFLLGFDSHIGLFPSTKGAVSSMKALAPHSAKCLEKKKLLAGNHVLELGKRGCADLHFRVPLVCTSATV